MCAAETPALATLDGSIIAVDSTKLISADSFLFAAHLARDPRAKADFQFIATAFCNDSTLYFAAPRSGQEQPHATELLKVWQRTAIRNDTVPVTLEDDRVFARMAPVFGQEFRDAGRSAELAAWLTYQLSHPELVDIGRAVLLQTTQLGGVDRQGVLVLRVQEGPGLRLQAAATDQLQAALAS